MCVWVQATIYMCPTHTLKPISLSVLLLLLLMLLSLLRGSKETRRNILAHSLTSVGRHTQTRMASVACGAPQRVVNVVPVLQDNYSYIIADWASHTAAVVDPVEPQKV